MTGRAALLALAVAGLAGVARAQGDVITAPGQSAALSATSSGQPIVAPPGPLQVTGSIIEIGAGQATPEHQHPYLAPWWPPGHMLGYEHGFAHQVVDLVTAIADGAQPEPSFADGLHVQRVLDTVERSSADDGRWTAVG